MGQPTCPVTIDTLGKSIEHGMGAFLRCWTDEPNLGHLFSLVGLRGRPWPCSYQVRHRTQLHTGGAVELSASAEPAGEWRVGKLTISHVDRARLEGFPEARCRLGVRRPKQEPSRSRTGQRSVRANALSPVNNQRKYSGIGLM